MLSSLELAAGAARVTLLPDLGGAIGAFTFDYTPVLRPTPAAALAERNVRLAACYPLVPYSNRIRAARLAFGGATHVLARNFGDHPHALHGVGWQRAWDVVAASATRATLTFEHAARGDDAAAWPWPFRATQVFDLCAPAAGHALLIATLTLVNTGPAPFPFGLGWHPFFPRDATTTLAFGADEVWVNDATALPIERVPAIGTWSFAVPRAFGAATIDNVFCGWNGNATLASMQRGIVTTIAADSACSRLVVFAPADRDFVAVEPVTHETDAFNRGAAGESATGMRVLPPRGGFSCTMRIGVAPRA